MRARAAMCALAFSLLAGCAGMPVALQYGPDEVYSVPMAQSIFTARFERFKLDYRINKVSRTDYEEGLRLAAKYSTAWNEAKGKAEAFDKGEATQEEAMEAMALMSRELDRVIEFIEQARERGGQRRQEA